VETIFRLTPDNFQMRFENGWEVSTLCAPRIWNAVTPYTRDEMDCIVANQIEVYVTHADGYSKFDFGAICNGNGNENVNVFSAEHFLDILNIVRNTPTPFGYKRTTQKESVA
jgi:hypothetical protein